MQVRAQKKNILLVDDEKEVLHALERVFFNENYQISTAGTAGEGLDIFRNQKIDMVISDYKMPQMNGYDFLQEVKKIKPDVIRILLSGYTEIEVSLKAIQDGVAKIYISKPWELDDLLQKINHIFDLNEYLHQNKVLNVIRKIDELPVLPSTYHHISSLLNQDADNDKILEVLEQEPAYVSKILKLVNSSFFGGNISSIHDALVFIGRKTLKYVIIYSELVDGINFPIYKQYSEENFWKHFKITNNIFHLLYKLKFKENIPNKFNSLGVLADLGIVIILKFFPNQAKMIIDEWIENQDQSILEIEEKFLGTNHSLISAYLFDWWNLPDHIIEVSLFHHDPYNKLNHFPEITALIHIADIYSWNLIEFSNEIKINEGILNSLNLTEKQINEEIEKHKKRILR